MLNGFCYLISNRIFYSVIKEKCIKNLSDQIFYIQKQLLVPTITHIYDENDKYKNEQKQINSDIYKFFINPLCFIDFYYSANYVLIENYCNACNSCNILTKYNKPTIIFR